MPVRLAISPQPRSHLEDLRFIYQSFPSRTGKERVVSQGRQYYPPQPRLLAPAPVGQTSRSSWPRRRRRAALLVITCDSRPIRSRIASLYPYASCSRRWNPPVLVPRRELCEGRRGRVTVPVPIKCFGLLPKFLLVANLSSTSLLTIIDTLSVLGVNVLFPTKP